MRQTSFLIIEDHPIFRDALASLLHDAFPSSSLRCTGTLREGIAVIAESRHAPIVILDVNLPDSSGAGGVRELLRLSPRLKVIALSADDSKDRQARLLRNGVHGFLPKTLSPELFISKLDALIRTRPINAEDESESRSIPTTQSLSARQKAVMIEMARGSSNKEIALSLGMGLETAKSHVSEIIRRLGVRNRSEAIRCYLAEEAGRGHDG